MRIPIVVLILLVAVVQLTILTPLFPPAEAQSLPVPPATCAPGTQPDMQTCTTEVDISAAPEATYVISGSGKDAQGNEVIFQATDFPLCEPLVRQRVGTKLRLTTTCKTGTVVQLAVTRK